MSSFVDEYPKEQARCRALLKVYYQLGPPGEFAAMMIERVLCEADKACVEANVVAMLSAFTDMKNCK